MQLIIKQTKRQTEKSTKNIQRNIWRRAVEGITPA